MGDEAVARRLRHGARAALAGLEPDERGTGCRYFVRNSSIGVTWALSDALPR